MAKISLKDITENSGRPYLPNGTYTLRIVEAERKVSSKGNDMVAIVAEVVEPTEVNGPRGFVEVGGVQVRDYDRPHNWAAVSELSLQRGAQVRSC